ncbi:hypothetical protein UFOVP181_348 [uncultured Caudovirales phage]|uniref:Uncharacterized protein n=1 Tax=uncultured Caudovirales phage TaxID=2100421 RepID=A0A6J7WEG4_9CAUD|nr:hypothetical protein UFOVP57_291 [uncultured Caudovirales phage]CAB5209181.1 hypothetical protein UFOVP181_348 [uncultured Caudovirales phage]
MLDALKQLFENNVISEEIKQSIESAWEARIVENKEQAAQQLREEFAQRYEHDKQTMIEAVDKMLTDRLSEELVEFADDRKQLAEMKVKYATKMKADGAVMKEFVSRQLASEVKELHEDQVAMAAKFGKLEQFVVEALAQEITEFFKDKQDLAETKVRLVREGRAQLGKVKQQFVERAAKMVESVVNKGLRTELTALKEDIDAARSNDFGRKLFEAFASEYQTSYLSEKSETAKLLKVIDLKELAVQEAAQAAADAQALVESKQAEIAALKEAQERKQIISELLAPLNSEQKEIMGELMESVKTTKLNESFEKYLPSVVSGGKAPQKKQALVEAKEVTGNKISNTKHSSEEDGNIIDIRRLAGLKF